MQTLSCTFCSADAPGAPRCRSCCALVVWASVPPQGRSLSHLEAIAAAAPRLLHSRAMNAPCSSLWPHPGRATGYRSGGSTGTPQWHATCGMLPTPLNGMLPAASAPIPAPASPCGTRLRVCRLAVLHGLHDLRALRFGPVATLTKQPQLRHLGRSGGPLR